MRRVAFCALTLLAASLGGGFLLTAETLVADLEAQARHEIDADIAALRLADRHAPLVGPLDILLRGRLEGGALVAMRDAGGQLLGGNLESWPEEGEDGGFFRFRQTADGARPILAREVALEGGVRLLVGRDLGGRTRFIRRVGLLFGAIFLIQSLVMLAGVIWLGRQERRRAAAILSVFQRLSQGETGSRVPAAGGRDPLSRLGVMLNLCLDNIDRLVGMRDWLEGALKHEMRSRLTDIMLKLPEATERDPAFAAIHEKVEDALRAFDGIMNLSRYRVGSILRGRRFRLDQLLGEAIASWQAEIAGQELRLTRTIAPMVMVEGQPDLLMMVLHNIVNNAIKYTPAGGALTLELLAGDGMATIRLGDTGPGLKGFPAGFTDAASIRPFRRGPAAENKDGLGLGLCLVRDVVELHQGSLSITEAPGGGTLITIRLPASG